MDLPGIANQIVLAILLMVVALDSVVVEHLVLMVVVMAVEGSSRVHVLVELLAELE